MTKFKSFLLETDLNEAAFSEKNIEKVSTLVASIISKDFGGTFYLLGKEKFKSRLHGQGAGIRFINTKGIELRFNWSKTQSKNSTFDITSVDYWDLKDKTVKPTLSVILNNNNIVQVVKQLVKGLKAGKAGKISLNEDLLEKKTADDRSEWLASKGIAKSYGKSIVHTKRAAEKNGLLEELEIFLGQEEINDKETKIQKGEKTLSATKYSDPEYVFKDIETMTSSVVAGLVNSLVIAGDAGIGKTHHTEKVLKAMLGDPNGANAEWRFISGAISTFSLYETLYFNRDNKVIFFDDADDVWKDESSVNVMKAALGDKRVRQIDWRSKFTQSTDAISQQDITDLNRRLDNLRRNSPGDVGMKGKNGEFNNQLPDKFEFTSRVIFTSNKPKSFFQKIGGGAIDSRSVIMDIHLTAEDMVNRIKTVGVLMGYNKSDVDNACDVLASNGSNLSIRKMVKAMDFIKAKIPDWERLVKLYL